MSDSNDDLLVRAIGGDNTAVDALLHLCGPAVRARLAGRISRKWSSLIDQDDIMQVTYLDAFLNIAKFKAVGPGALLAWLNQIAENNLRDAIKGLEREKRPDPARRIQPKGDDSLLALYELLGATSSTPSREVARREAHAALTHAIQKLPEVYQRVVQLYELQGRPVTDVAQAIGRTVPAVFMIRARALDRLRDLLGSASGIMADSS